MKKLNLLAIRIDGGTQARLALNQDVVHEYAEHMKDGDVFPPVVVFHDGSDYWLADGFHRFFATKANGNTSIEAEVKDGTQEDATLWAFGANGRRGLSMSTEDNRNIIKRMLEHPIWSQWTNAEIARHVGVSKMTVGRVKSSMDPKDEPTQKKYVGKHGESTIQTKHLGKKVKSDAEKNPEPEGINEQEDQLGELAETISTLEQENQVLKDKIAIGQWDATEFEKMDVEETLASLREQIRVLEIDNKALRDSRDMFQARNAELMKTVKSLQTKLKKYEK